jgi:heat shock protein HtpX
MATSGLLAHFGTLLFGWALQLLLLAFSSAMWRDSQRGEFLADGISAWVAGSNASVSMLMKMHYRSVFEYARSWIRTGLSQIGIYEEVERQLREVPNGERERIGRSLQYDAARVDSTHPPTAHRIEFVETLDEAGRYTLSPEDFAAIRQELAPAFESFGEELLVKAGA